MVPSQCIRVSPASATAITAGLNWLEWHYRMWTRNRFLPHGHPRARAEATGQRWVAPADLLAVLWRLRARFRPLRGCGGRVRGLSSLDLTALMFAVRLAHQLSRRGVFRPVFSVPITVGRLLRRLERLRKRAKRADIFHLGKSRYSCEMGRWRAFVRSIRRHFVYFGRQRLGLASRRRQIIRQLVAWTKPELLDRGITLPPNKELTRLVRLAVRYVRRGRTTYSIRDLLADRSFAAYRLAAFITIRLEKAHREE